MKIKNTEIVIFLFAIVISSCSKDQIAPTNVGNKITISTNSISSIGQNSAVSGGVLTEISSNTVTDKGLCWATSFSPTINSNVVSSGPGLSSFGNSMTNLIPGTLYYVRAYVSTPYETIYGNQQQFLTLAYTLPVITTSGVSNITLTTASSGGSVSSQGGGAVTSKGVCWSNSSNPTINNNKTMDGSGLGSYISSLTGLTPGTTYYLRAYATNQAGTAYGAQSQFTTVAISLATVGTVTLSSITKTGATGSSSITADGGGTVTQRGICWNTTGSPTIFNSTSISGSGTGSFSATLSGLITGTIYYVRAFATNSAGTSYSTQQQFKTL